MRGKRLTAAQCGFALGCLLLVALAACTPTPTQGAWDEPFDAPGTWRLASDAAAQVTLEEGQLRFHILQPGQIAWAAAGRSFGDFTLQVEATQLDGPADNEYGVLVRMDGDQRFYVFSVSGDGYARVARYDAGVWTVLGGDWAAYAAVKQGAAANLLEVEVRGAQFVFRVNGEEVARREDPTLARGDIGLYAGAFDAPDVRVAFDNLRVVPLNSE